MLSKFGITESFIQSLTEEDLLMGRNMICKVNSVIIGDSTLISHKLLILRNTTPRIYIKYLIVEQAQFIYKFYFGKRLSYEEIIKELA